MLRKSVQRGALMLLALAAVSAEAAFFEFSYTFEANRSGTSGHVLEGVVAGELQPDGDTIVIDTFVSASLAGIAYGIGEDIGIRAADVTGPAVMSLSGDTLDFWVCPQGFTGEYPEPYAGGDCPFGVGGGGFLISDDFDFGPTPVGNRAHAGIAELGARYRDSDSPVAKANWSAREVDRVRAQFSYMFEANRRGVFGHRLNGVVEGLLRGDGDTIQILSFLEADLDGAPYDIDPGNIGIRAGDQDAPASFTLSGELIDFWVCVQGFTGEAGGAHPGGDCPFGAEGGFLVSDNVDFGTGVDFAIAGIPAFGPAFRDVDAPIEKANWSAEITRFVAAQPPRGAGRNGKGRGREKGRGKGLRK